MVGSGAAPAPAAGSRTTTAAAVIARADVRTPANPDYRLSLSSDAKGHDWTGTESVSFENVSPDPLLIAWIRLWDNGIAGCSHPAVQVSNVTGGTPGPLSVDCTALPITLPRPLAQSARASVSFDLSIAVPDRSDRFGHVGPTALLGNAIPVLAILWWDATAAFNFDGRFGIGAGTLVLLVNIVLLTLYTFSCHSLRHLAGGHLDCFSCAAFGGPRFGVWRGLGFLNERHMLFAWMSLFSVGLADLYVRLVASGAIKDVRLL